MTAMVEQSVSIEHEVAPGIVAHRWRRTLGLGYTLLHAESRLPVAPQRLGRITSYPVNQFPRLREAREAAERLSGLVDWTLPQDELVEAMRGADTRRQIRAACVGEVVS